MTSPIAYSYIRFSTKEQRKGHSLERQTERAKAWCDRNGIALDASQTYHDLGMSAFLGEHRSNPDRHALAAFLRMVEEDRIPRGSFLIIESLDRLTREHVRAGLMLCLNLIEKGVRIVQLSPSEIVYDDKADSMALMLMICELSRGHGESKRKSDLSGPAWRKKKLAARDGAIVTDRLPAWVRVESGRLALIPDRAETVKRIFELTIAGYGIPRIVSKFTREGVPAIGKTGRWVKGYIGRILRDRRAMGEYQPRMGPDRVPDGDPVPGYFPAVVTEEEFNAARAGSAQRAVNPVVTKSPKKVAGGRVEPKKARTPKERTGDEKVNVFARLIVNAREGDSYFMTLRTQKKGPPRYHVLINSNSEQGRSPCFAFQYDPFERAVLSLLSEIDPAEIVGEDKSSGEAMALAGELAELKADLATLSEKLDKKVTPTLMAAAERKDERLRIVAAKLAEAKQRQASPLADAWGESQSLIATLDAAPDQADARLRLRSALRRIVAGMWLLVVPRGRDRLAAVQINFAESKAPRSYLIALKTPRHNGASKPAKPGRCEVGSLARVVNSDRLDLRKRQHADRLAAVLEKIDLAPLFEEPQ